MRHPRIVVSQYGGPDELRVVEEECPEPNVSDLGGIPIDCQHQAFVKEIPDLTSEGADAVFDGIGGTQAQATETGGERPC